MEDIASKDCPIVEIKNVQSDKNIVIQTVTDYNSKNRTKTATYYLKVEDENTKKRNQEVEFVSLNNETLPDEAIEDDTDTEYVALEVQDSGQIIFHEKDVILWGELCRICANGCDQFVPIFTGEGLENNLSQKIRAHLPVTVSTFTSLEDFQKLIYFLFRFLKMMIFHINYVITVRQLW